MKHKKFFFPFSINTFSQHFPFAWISFFHTVCVSHWQYLHGIISIAFSWNWNTIHRLPILNIPLNKRWVKRVSSLSSSLWKAEGSLVLEFEHGWIIMILVQHFFQRTKFSPYSRACLHTSSAFWRKNWWFSFIFHRPSTLFHLDDQIESSRCIAVIWNQILIWLETVPAYNSFWWFELRRKFNFFSIRIHAELFVKVHLSI